MKLPLVITIDGPAASGKSSIGQEIAERIDYHFLDTGVMYRAVTWKAIEDEINPNDEKAITRLTKRIKIQIQPPSKNDGRKYDVLVDNVDVTWDIFKPMVNDNISIISTYPGVRKTLTYQQRKIGLNGNVVMVGRDIGTVVMPDAELKIFLEASLVERAQRRFKEEIAQGNKVSYEDILNSMSYRDRIDTNRKLAPLKPAADATIIQTNGKDKVQVIKEIMKLITNWSNA